MKKQIKKQIALKSFKEVDKVLYEIACLSISIEKKTVEMQQKILDITNRYEPEIKELKKNISDFEKHIDEFLTANKKDFETKRSKNLTYGRVGFRTGQNALKTLSKKITWEFVKEKVLSLFNGKYIDTAIKLNKVKMIKDAEKGILTPEQLAAAGCKLVKDESTFYELNLDEIKIEE